MSGPLTRAAAFAGSVAVILALAPAGVALARQVGSASSAALTAGPMAAAPAAAGTRGNANCPGEEVPYDPGNGEDVALPGGYTIRPLITDLNFPTAIAFVGNKSDFKILVLESGKGLPGACND